MKLPRTSGTLLGLALLAMPKTALACAVCMGDPNSPIAPAVNAAIFLMLGFIGTVLTGVAGFAFYLNKRSKKPLPPHQELVRAISAAQ